MKKLILLIEDDAIVRENTAEILRLANYQVQTAENGKLGIEMASLQRPDLIICDILMPVLDGFGVLQIVLRNEELKRIPFIFMSAKTDHSDLRKGMDLGASDYITKPFEESELLSAIETRLKLREAFIVDEIRDSGKEILYDDLKKYLRSQSSFFYPKGSAIYLQDNLGKDLFYIISGKVKKYKVYKDGKEQIIYVANTGELIGYHAILSEGRYPDSAAALEETAIAFFTKEDFLKTLEGSAILNYRLLKNLSHEFAVLANSITLFAQKSVRERLALQLIVMREKYKVNFKQGMPVEINMSRDDLASLVGTARENVVRVLSEFKEENIVRTIGRKIIVLDVTMLIKIANYK